MSELSEDYKQLIRDKAAEIYEAEAMPKAGAKFRSGEWDYRLADQFRGAEIALSKAIQAERERIVKELRNCGWDSAAEFVKND